MKEDNDDITALWQQVKAKNQTSVAPNLTEVKNQAAAKKKSALWAHYGNAGVLTLTVLMLIFYFYYLYNFQDVLSNLGINLMIGGLIIRILIELYSAFRSRTINVSDTAAQSLQSSDAFHEFRKRIHGPVTIIIFALYFVGFYMLTPEFSRYISFTWMVIMDVGALVVAAILILFIRKGIRQELKDLEKMVELQRSLVQ
ncbi:MAG TPA: hypothetical protein VFM90_10775 [Cyclobacteriaceae bacterium]|nr:hypothetical protein [Cyclobacteriaceae bacterium]